MKGFFFFLFRLSFFFPFKLVFSYVKDFLSLSMLSSVGLFFLLTEDCCVIFCLRCLFNYFILSWLLSSFCRYDIKRHKLFLIVWPKPRNIINVSFIESMNFYRCYIGFFCVELRKKIASWCCLELVRQVNLPSILYLFWHC